MYNRGKKKTVSFLLLTCYLWQRKHGSCLCRYVSIHKIPIIKGLSVIIFVWKLMNITTKYKMENFDENLFTLYQGICLRIRRQIMPKFFYRGYKNTNLSGDLNGLWRPCLGQLDKLSTKGCNSSPTVKKNSVKVQIQSHNKLKYLKH